MRLYLLSLAISIAFLPGCEILRLAAKSAPEALSSGLSGLQEAGIWGGIAAFVATFGKTFARLYSDHQAAKSPTAVAVPSK